MTENMVKKKEITTLETIELKIPAMAEYIDLVRLSVSGIGNRMDLTIDEIEDLKTAVSEACNNSIRHAYRKADPRNSIEIRFLIYQKKIMIKIKDFGHGFDTKFIKEYIRRQDNERNEGIGIGLYLIKTLMDEVEYSSDPKSGTEVSLIKKLQK